MLKTYKFTHGIYKCDSSQFFAPNHRRLRGHAHTLFKQRATTTLRQNFFSQRVINKWNGLPDDYAEASSVASLRKRLRAAP